MPSNSTLKNYFLTGLKPTQNQFHEFIDELDRYSGSIQSLILTSESLSRYNVDSGSFNTNINNRLLTSVYTTDSASFANRINNVTVDTSSLVTNQRYNQDSGSFNTNINNRLLTSVYTVDSASFSNRINNVTVDTSSLVTSVRYNQDSSSFNTNINNRLLTNVYTTDSASIVNNLSSISSSLSVKQDRFQGVSINNSQSVIIDFNIQYHSINLLSIASFSSVNLGPNKFANLRVVTSQSSCLFSFPSQWSWMNTLPPVSQSSNTNGILSLVSWGNSNQDVQVAYSVKMN